MRYLGGKFRIRTSLATAIKNFRSPGQLYIEPFIGSAWTFSEFTNPRIGSDACLDLILLWNALQNGWEPPVDVSHELYVSLQHSTIPSPLRGFVGFGCSFSGKWFGGYARSGTRNYAKNARNSLMKKVAKLKGARIFCSDYKSIQPTGSLVYCDPPYAGTTGYKGIPSMDYIDYWNTIRVWSVNNTVLVSEYTAPRDFTCVKEFPTRTDLRNTAGVMDPRIERLFMYNG